MPKLYSQVVGGLKIYDKCKNEMLKNTLFLSDTIDEGEYF